MQSPCLKAFHVHFPVRLTIDSGHDKGCMCRQTGPKSLQQYTVSSSGRWLLAIEGGWRNTQTFFKRDGHMLFFDGLVVENLDLVILAGILFMECNNISIHPASHQVCVGSDTYEYGANLTYGDRHAIRSLFVVLLGLLFSLQIMLVSMLHSVTVLSVRLDDSSVHQLRLVVGRYFYVLDLNSAIQLTSKGCHQCAAVAKSPVFAVEQSSYDPPETVGSNFAVDVLKRELILVVCECVTSFTAAFIH
ncbi:NACHT, LRR and PYD domains-containing protein 4F [Labeo rohita]|uniref:NACHT, LRR and PYD domains-containing protein 4F n=1 Tax=Labeo rohita TaxID=84645 RepID=A0ABQ8MMJ3_LABRO|nr:NACHT, LRR and PYD domains-containing protein 4F [Labeo rohita]